MTKPTWHSEEWVAVLATECQRTSQNVVGRELGVSGSMVNQVIHGNYRAGVERIRGLVQGRYMDRRVVCPVLNEIPFNECLDHQKRPFSGANPTRVKLFRACPGCPHKR